MDFPARKRGQRGRHRLDAALHVEQLLDLLLAEHQDGHQGVARASASAIVSLLPDSVARAISSGESSAWAWSTNSRSGVPPE